MTKTILRTAAGTAVIVAGENTPPSATNAARELARMSIHCARWQTPHIDTTRAFVVVVVVVIFVVIKLNFYVFCDCMCMRLFAYFCMHVCVCVDMHVCVCAANVNVGIWKC